ncbi:MAG: hypothetical protein ACJA2W_000898 [Planctomycetota bacterium]
MLANGNVLVAWAAEALEFRCGTNEVVWRYGLSKTGREIGTVQRLEDGRTLVTELGPMLRLLEVDSYGRVLLEVPLSPETDNAQMQTRMARKESDGTYLVPQLLAHAVKRYSADGEVLETFPTDVEALGGRVAVNWPFTAIRLPSGGLLVGCTHGNKVVEFDASGDIAWTLTNDDVGGVILDACGVQRLPNGNTVVASYNAREGVKLFEVNRAKDVVWTYEGPHRAHHFQVLTTNGQPLPGPPMR